jgi:DNA-binding MarR family transcriptional regulator
MINSECAKDLFMGLTYKVHGLVMLMDKEAEKFLQEQLNLSYNQFLIIFAISEKCANTQKEVAYFANLTEAAVSKQSETLRKLGYLTRIESQKDRREHILELTESGNKLLSEAISIMHKYAKDLLSILDNSELENLNHYLSKLYDKASQNTTFSLNN